MSGISVPCFLYNMQQTYSMPNFLIAPWCELQMCEHQTCFSPPQCQQCLEHSRYPRNIVDRLTKWLLLIDLSPQHNLTTFHHLMATTEGKSFSSTFLTTRIASWIIQIGSKPNDKCSKRDRRGKDTVKEEKVMWRQLKRLEWCDHKTRNSRSHQNKKHQGRILPKSFQRVHTHANLDFGILGVHMPTPLELCENEFLFF